MTRGEDGRFNKEALPAATISTFSNVSFQILSTRWNAAHIKAPSQKLAAFLTTWMIAEPAILRESDVQIVSLKEEMYMVEGLNVF